MLTSTIDFAPNHGNHLPLPTPRVSIPKVRSSTFLHLGSNISLANLRVLVTHCCAAAHEYCEMLGDITNCFCTVESRMVKIYVWRQTNKSNPPWTTSDLKVTWPQIQQTKCTSSMRQTQGLKGKQADSEGNGILCFATHLTNAILPAHSLQPSSSQDYGTELLLLIELL